MIICIQGYTQPRLCHLDFVVKALLYQPLLTGCGIVSARGIVNNVLHDG